MAVENLTATRRHPIAMTTANANQVPKDANMVAVCSTVEVTAAASATSTYTMGRVASAARIMPLSTLYWDDLASTGAPTLDIGFAADPDALNDGLDAATAASSAGVFKAANIANVGLPAWQLAGLSSDPGGFLDVIVTLADADANTGGTLSMVLIYTVDN
ncbi:hypothetical protein [Albimonas pacifica]|uniref:Uncharacterized protein n=1 Tax=Albimonas pacifica TaxID=1114924 RepID=A0A1I3LHI3_9RHOB|nr:hypothetical protein [Albimonas pacifica]SFI84238.1 hypothetical protein SAMN05216258_11034 [Albimonas pacifica]